MSFPVSRRTTPIAWPSPFRLNTTACGPKMKWMRYSPLICALVNVLWLDCALLYLIVKALSTRW